MSSLLLLLLLVLVQQHTIIPPHKLYTSCIYYIYTHQALHSIPLFYCIKSFFYKYILFYKVDVMAYSTFDKSKHTFDYGHLRLIITQHFLFFFFTNHASFSSMLQHDAV
ncbi:hypothetical protein PS15m_002549 [Mucor circinelloides]